MDMGSVQRKNTNIVVISCLVLVLLALSFHPLAASLPGCPENKSWPELVGLPGCEAAARIKKENSAYAPIVIPYDAPVPLNYLCNRVFIGIKGHKGVVYSAPRTG